MSVKKNPGIAIELRQWVAESNVEKVSLNKLLKILRRYGHKKDLPKDYRSLLSTPRTINLVDIPPGKYYHFGLVSGLKNLSYVILQQTMLRTRYYSTST